MITLDILKLVCPDTKVGRLAIFVEPINVTQDEFLTPDPWDLAAFIAQTAHESGAFYYLREIWGPTPDQEGYEPPGHKADQLGNTMPGDGRRYLGRGLIQTTGRGNYRKAAGALGLPLEEEPELLEQPIHAARSAGYFWKTHGLSAKASAKQFAVITRGVNGLFREFRPGDLDRYGYYEAACAALGLTSADQVG